MDGDFQSASWLVRPSLNSVSRNDTSAQVEPKVMAGLVCLAARVPEPVPKEKLLQEVWPDTFVGEAVLLRSIFELRQVFEDEAKEPRVIQTIAKRGSLLVAPVIPVNGTSGRPSVASLETQLVRGARWLGNGDGTFQTLHRDKIGFIFQFFNLLLGLSCRENVALPQGQPIAPQRFC